MASFDGAYESLIQGVSEQVPISRLPGQVSEQINMVSDPVTGVRRRVGAALRMSFKSEGASKSMLAWKADIGGVSCEVFLNTVTGELILFEEGGTQPVARFKDDYLKTPQPNTIQHTGVGDSLFILNTLQIPEAIKDTGANKFKNYGYFNVTGSALRQTFTVAVTHQGNTYTGSYTTPDGTKPEHVGQVTSEYVAQQILTNLNSKGGFTGAISTSRQGSVVSMNSKDGQPITVSVTSGKVYINSSQGGVIESTNDLVAVLPSHADGMIIGVGKLGGDLTYFKYNSKEVRWYETSEPGGTSGIRKMPLELYWDSNKWVLLNEEYPGRLAGDPDSNPDPEFIGWGITGMASYQGRLVLMSGSWVYLSATNEPRQFYRTSVEELLDTDPIEIGSSSASSASFQYGVVFNKDLILFSSSHQALIPGLNQALTPKNAHILVTSTYTSDLTTQPTTLGSSLMYPMPRSSTHYGVMEMIPSAYADSMYESVDASEHIPTYLKGRCRFMVASTVGSMVVLGSTENLRELYVHEYMWAGGEKVLKAWHKWEFQNEVATAFFSGGLINLVTVDPKSGTVFVTSLDPKAGEGSDIDARTYFLDNYITLEVKRKGTGKSEEVWVDLPEYYRDFIVGQEMQEELRVIYYGGDLNSVEIGATTCPECKKIFLNNTTTATRVVVGIPYESIFIPGQPVFKDHLDRPIMYNRVQLIKMYVTSYRTGTFYIEVNDTARRGGQEYSVNPVRWLSTDLNLSRLPIGGTECSVIPCRVDAKTSEVVFRSQGMSEMNILSLEYTCRGARMRARR